MAKVFVGGGFFLLESAISGYALLGESTAAIPGALLMTFAGAAPLAYQMAKSVFDADADSGLEGEAA